MSLGIDPNSDIGMSRMLNLITRVDNIPERFLHDEHGTWGKHKGQFEQLQCDNRVYMNHSNAYSQKQGTARMAQIDLD